MQQAFPRALGSLEEIFAFAAKFFDTEGIDPEHHFAVNFALEEIFTNLVKYASGCTGDVEIDLDRTADGMRVRLTEWNGKPFDPASAPQPRVDAPLEERRVGGLGLFLTRKVMDSMDYEYVDGRSTITLTKRLS